MTQKQEENVGQHSFGRLDTWFIDKYLRHEGETLEAAMCRVRQQQKEREANRNVPNTGSRR